MGANKKEKKRNTIAPFLLGSQLQKDLGFYLPRLCPKTFHLKKKR